MLAGHSDASIIGISVVLLDGASGGSSPRVAVVQDGARLHYAVPIALQRGGALERVYTDWYAAKPIERLVSAVLPPFADGRVQRMRERVAADLDARLVFSKPSLALQQLRRSKYANEIDFCTMLRARISRWIRSAGFGQANGLFGFVRNIDPAICELAKSRGLNVVVDQMIAPFDIERSEAQKQQKRFPAWGTDSTAAAGDAQAEDERRTWRAADRITCASDYVRDGLVSCGVDPAKIAVLPYPFDAGKMPTTDRPGRIGPVTVGFVGSVGVRKGVPYLLQLAARFVPTRVRFVLVGPVSIPPDVLATHRGPAEIVGPVPRSEVAGWLGKFDVFCLPSTCEGSAGAVAEAMAAGLPVVVSPNAGAPITHGVEGFIAPYDDVDALQRHIETLAANAAMRHEMGLAARRRIETFSLDHYGRQLVTVFCQTGKA
jgi:hypothetical protein